MKDLKNKHKDLTKTFEEADEYDHKKREKEVEH